MPSQNMMNNTCSPSESPNDKHYIYQIRFKLRFVQRLNFYSNRTHNLKPWWPQAVKASIRILTRGQECSNDAHRNGNECQNGYNSHFQLCRVMKRRFFVFVPDVIAQEKVHSVLNVTHIDIVHVNIGLPVEIRRKNYFCSTAQRSFSRPSTSPTSCASPSWIFQI